MLLNEGLEETATQYKDLITKGQWGTATTTPVITDLGLGLPISSTLLAMTSTSNGNGIKLTHNVNSATANGEAFSEHETQFADGSSFNKIVLNVIINKTSAFSVSTDTIVTFLRG